MSARLFLDSIGSRYRRIYVLFSSTGVTEPVFTSRSLATQGGRMDVVARAALYSLMDIEKCRSDALFIAHLQGPPSPPKQVYIDCRKIHGRSEKEIGEVIKNELVRGVYTDISFIHLVNIIREKSEVYLLHEGGVDISRIDLEAESSASTFIVGDQIGFPQRLERELFSLCKPVSIGRKVYLASHVILYLNEFLDRLMV